MTGREDKPTYWQCFIKCLQIKYLKVCSRPSSAQWASAELWKLAQRWCADYEKACGAWLAGPVLDSSSSSSGVRMLQEKSHTGNALLLSSLWMTTSTCYGIYSCQKMLIKWRNRLPPPLVRAPEERLLSLWVSPHTVLSKQICNLARKSWALGFIFGLIGEPDNCFPCAPTLLKSI